MKKKQLSDLALSGGKALFAEPLHVGRPNIPDRVKFISRVNDILDRRWLTNGGQYVAGFERKIEKLLGVKHCIAVCNGTIGLEIVCRALDLHGEVLVPAVTFVATAHCLKWQEITPVFCDVDAETYNIDIESVEQHISSKTTAILAVHLWGRPCNIRGLEAIAKKNGLKLIFDASHALACSYQGGMVGNFGNAEVFSFHATKFINTLEGGAIVTNDDALAQKIRLMKNFGYTGFDQVGYLGTNGKMNEISAAMGITSLESIQEFIEINKRNYLLYKAFFDCIPGVRIMSYSGRETFNYQYIVIEVDEAETGVGRDALYDVLWAENVRVRKYFYPGCHRMEPYNSLYSEAQKNLPTADKLLKKLLVFPTGSAVSSVDIKKIRDFFLFCVKRPQEINYAVRKFKGVGRS